MTDVIYTDGYPDNPYYTDEDVRGRVDDVLKECAALYAAKGQRQLVVAKNGYKWAKNLKKSELEKAQFADDLPVEEQKDWYQTQEANLLSKIRHLDPSFIDNLWPEDM